MELEGIKRTMWPVIKVASLADRSDHMLTFGL